MHEKCKGSNREHLQGCCAAQQNWFHVEGASVALLSLSDMTSRGIHAHASVQSRKPPGTLPAGTGKSLGLMDKEITVLVSDVEGSTALWEEWVAWTFTCFGHDNHHVNRRESIAADNTWMPHSPELFMPGPPAMILMDFCALPLIMRLLTCLACMPDWQQLVYSQRKEAWWMVFCSFFFWTTSPSWPYIDSQTINLCCGFPPVLLIWCLPASVDDRCPEAMSKALEMHDKLLRQILKRHFGYEVGSILQSACMPLNNLAFHASEPPGIDWAT